MEAFGEVFTQTSVSDHRKTLIIVDIVIFSHVRDAPLKLGTLSEKKNGIMWEKFPNLGGGV